jgi:transposase
MQPCRKDTVAEACERIFQLTGLRRGPSQVRKFLKELGLKFQRVRMIPVPPQKTWPSTSKPKPLSTTLN